MQHVGGRGAEGAPGGSGLALRDDHLLYAELAREHARVRRPGATEGEEHEVARIEAFLHRHLADDVGHVQLDDAADARGGLDCLLCRHHHTVIHQGNWHIRWATDGTPEFIPPEFVDPERKPRRNTMHHIPDLLNP